MKLKTHTLYTVQQSIRRLFLCITFMMLPLTAIANHSVLVEGGSDFDGDGLIGADEDSDGDQVFGSINGGLNGVSNNGRVTVVTSGRFFEQVIITAVGAVVLEAAPGVDANIEAFNGGGDAAANSTRQNQPGVIVDSNGEFPVTIRNIVSRNWTSGFLVRNNSRVTLDNVRADSNVSYGIQVINSAKAVITNSQINGNGFRRSGTEGIVDPSPGDGITFRGLSSGTVTNTTITHNARAGLFNRTGNNSAVSSQHNTIFGNRFNRVDAKSDPFFIH